MSTTVEVRPSDENAAGLTLPEDLMRQMNLQAGDRVQLVETPGGWTLRRDASEFDRQMDLADHIMRDNHDLLRRLAE